MVQVDFPSWYQGELRPLLSGPPAPPGATPEEAIAWHMLRCRCLWLLGVCGGELPFELWADAFSVMASHVSAGECLGGWSFGWWGCAAGSCPSNCGPTPSPSWRAMCPQVSAFALSGWLVIWL